METVTSVMDDFEFSDNLTILNDTDQTQLDPVCRTSSTILHTPGLLVLIAFVFFFGVLACLVNFCFFCAVWKVSIFHMNLRIAFAHVSFLAIVFCTPCVIKVSTLFSALVRDDPCSLVMDSAVCRLQEIPRSWANQAILYACACVTVERLYCTVRYKKPYHEFPWLGLILVPLCYTVPLVTFVRSTARPSTKVPVCENLASTSPDAAKVTLSTNAAFTVVSLVLICILHYWNRKVLNRMLTNRAITHTLAARFQLGQNAQVTKIIGPLAILEMLTFIPTYVFLLLVICGLDLSQQNKTILIWVSHFWKICFCLAYPLMAFVRNGHVRRGLVKVAPPILKHPMCKRAVKVGIATSVIGTPKVARVKSHAKTHFEILDKAWMRP